MSPPTALLVSRYRSFAGTETMPLRPLTLVYGRNNSGKSALCRALAIVGASVAKDSTSALVVPPQILRDGAFSDLAWRGDAGDYSFDLGLRWDYGELREARYTLDGGSARPTYVKELLLRGEGERLLWSGIAPPSRPMRPQGDHSGGELSFAGLVPQSSDVPALQELAARMEALRGRIQWLDGVRARPEREVKRTGTAPTQLTTNGSNSAQFLVERPELVEKIKLFYAALEPPRELEVKEVLDIGHRITLNPTNRASFRIDLIDTGEGMAQVLPVLVAAALAEDAGPGSLLTVEEPESHLHPDAQSVLARHLCTIAARPEAPTLVLETHSATLRALRAGPGRIATHGGGGGEVKRWLEALSNGVPTAERWRRMLRAWVLFDQDSGDLDAREPSASAARLMRACEDVVSVFGAGLSWICLRRREIESYVPDSGLRAQKADKSAFAEHVIGWRDDDGFRSWAWALDLKKGLHGDRHPRWTEGLSEADVAAVKRGQQPLMAHMLKAPFSDLSAPDIAALTSGFGEALGDGLLAGDKPAWTSDIPAEYDRGPSCQAPRPDFVQSLFDRM